MNVLRTVVLMVVFCGLLSGCSSCRFVCERPQPPVFSGQVVSNFGKALSEATVDVNGQTATTDREGFFRLTAVPLSSKYVVTIRKSGYGMLSKVSTREIEGKRWTLTQATVVTVDPTKPNDPSGRIVVRDLLSTSGCLGMRIPSAWESLEIVNGPHTPALIEALNAAYTPAQCSSGISVAILPNTLVDSAGNVPVGPVEVSLATVDVWSPDAMPGDFSVLLQDGRNGDGERGKSETTEGKALTDNSRIGFMQTFGAGFVSISSGGKTYQPKPGTTTKLNIPIDPTQLKRLQSVEQLPSSTIPLLVYDEVNAIWVKDGTATLNASKNAYEADLGHFSAFNMDVVFTNPACAQIDSRLINGSYHLRVVVPPVTGFLTPHEFDIPNATGCGATSGDPLECFIHSAYRLPSTQSYTDGGLPLPQKGTVIPSRPIGANIESVDFTIPPASTGNPNTYDSGTDSYPACSGTKVILSDKPTLSMTTTLPDRINLTMAFIRPSSAIVAETLNDGFRLQRCTITVAETCDVNSVAGWQTFDATWGGPASGIVPGGRVPPPYPVNVVLIPVGTHKIRVRAHVGDTSFVGSSGVDTAASDPVDLSVLGLAVTNNYTTLADDQRIVRLRLASTNAKIAVDTFVSLDASLPAAATPVTISSPGNHTIKIAAILPTYELYIGFGSWSFDGANWAKINHQIAGCGGACDYHYQYFSVAGQPANTTWTVAIDSAGTMTLKDQGAMTVKTSPRRTDTGMDPVDGAMPN